MVADCYYAPEPGLLERVDGLEGTLAPLTEEGARWAEAMRDTLSVSRDWTPLLVEYSRLFVGPFRLPAPPYGSVYLEQENRVMGLSTNDAADFYSGEGLDLSEGFLEAPDHIAVELEFVQFLAQRESEALGMSDMKQASYYADRQRVFLERHLGAWVSQFTQRIIEETRTDFYRCLAWVTRCMVLSTLEALKSRS